MREEYARISPYGKRHGSLQFFLAWFLVVSFLLAGCQGKTLETSLLHSDSLLGGESVLNDVTPGSVLFALEEDTGVDLPRAMLIVNPEILSQALSTLENREWYGQIVILAGESGKVSFKSSVKQFFPDAEMVELALGRDMNSQSVEIMAHTLASNLDDRSFVLAVTQYESASPEPVASFQRDFMETVLGSFDPYRADELPLAETVPVAVLQQYLLRSGTQKVEYANLGRGIAVTYGRGGAVEPENDSVFFVALGDIMLGRYVRTLMDANSMDYPFEKMDAGTLRINDFLIANLEGPVTEKAVKTSTGMSFGFFPDVIPLLKKYHFDVISQANNHTLDKGQKAYEESMTLLRKGGLIAFGHPNDINSDSVAKVHVRGQKVAFMGLEEVNTKIDDDKSVELVKKLVQEGYRVIPFLHYGVEYTHEPTERQKELAHKLIDAGAYAIIAHHPHVPEAYENYNGHPIFYSLGNAVFDQYWSKATQEGLGLAIKISDNRFEAWLLPVSLEKSQIRLMNDDERKNFLERFAEYGDLSDEEKEMVRTGKITLPL